MRPIRIYFALFLIGLSLDLSSQTTSYKQFWNELALVKALSDKYALELDLANSFSDTPEKPSIFSTHTQLSLTSALQYYYSAKLNFSFLTAYYANKYVPEIGQRKYPEIRLGLEATYFFRKIGYISQSRTKIEYRLIQNPEEEFEDVFRFRERMRFTKPFGRKYIRENTFYGIISDEIFIKAPTSITGPQIFDRNDLTGGFGYALTNNFTIDLLYTIQYAPRPSGDEVFHAIQLNLRINNPFIQLKDKLKKKVELF